MFGWIVMLMIPIKTGEQIEIMREASRIAADVLAKLAAMVAPGVNTYDLDQAGKELMAASGAISACYNYRVGNRFFPAHTCLSINEEIVHGIGSIKTVLRPGDIISIDVAVIYQGFIGDNAKTVPVGRVSEEVGFLIKSTEGALYYAIDFARSGNRVGDISSAVQRYINKRNLGIVRDFVGHGVGRTMHEEPQIPNFGRRGTGQRLKPGMTLAIEPMVNLGRPEVSMLPDGWTAITRDKKPSAHYEHTVLVTEDEPEILTLPKK